jgi:transcriptional regulator GlxA family with amidase domain
MLDRVLAVNLTAAVKRFNDTAVGYPWSDDPDLYPVQRDRPYVRRARAILDKQFAEKISLAALAEQTDVSPYHLQRTFRAATGLSPLHYQANLRVSQARALLCAGRSLSRVAAEVGFGDQSHLTKHFHRVFGISPGRFVSNRKNRQDVGASARNNTNG